MELTSCPTDIEAVTEQLGHSPRGRFKVVVRNGYGKPVVILNSPLMHDGTPMPTIYWLCGPDEIRRVGIIESNGGVDRAEREVDPEALAECHDRYERERVAMFDAEYQGYSGPRPSGGVGGTRTGVKCLHAHYAYLLAGGDDPVGRWTQRQLNKQ